MIRLNKDGETYEFATYKAALIHFNLWTGPASADTSIKRLQKNGFTFDSQPAPATRTTTAPAAAPQPVLITVPATAPAQPTPAPRPAAQPAGRQTSIEDAIRQLVEQVQPATAPINEDTIRTIVQQEIAKAPQAASGTITVKVAELPAVTIGRQHEKFQRLLTVCANRKHPMLIGPAGSGKTTAAENVAKALNLPFYAVSVGMQTSKTDLLGYNDANGRYNTTPLRQAYEFGGIFLLDEIDAGNPNVLTTLNAALANGVCSFPDGMIKKNPDFICIAAGNTFGTGPNRQYVGRNQLDAATLTRFARIVWEYDEKLELELCADKTWCRDVQLYRRRAAEKAIRVVISPRASLDGACLIAAGIPQEEVEDMLIFSGLDEATIRQIKGH